jgi:SAM-dependent methyltransferase
MVEQTSFLISKWLVCPVCKGELVFATGLIACEACHILFPQSRQDCFDLLPQNWLTSRWKGWETRQAEMEKWYGDLVETPALAITSFKEDYSPFARALETLSGSILDVGGGSGIARHYLPHATTYIVIDPCLDWLKARWSSLAGAFPCLANKPLFVHGLGEHLPFPSGVFDAVLAFWSLNHAGDPRLVFQEVSRVLRPGGRFLAVLEDMVPSLGDILRRMLSGGICHGVGFLRAKYRLLLRGFLFGRSWPLQRDHARIHESDIRSWASPLFHVKERIWRGDYLTFEFILKGSQ